MVVWFILLPMHFLPQRRFSVPSYKVFSKVHRWVVLSRSVQFRADICRLPFSACCHPLSIWPCIRIISLQLRRSQCRVVTVFHEPSLLSLGRRPGNFESWFLLGRSQGYIVVVLTVHFDLCQLRFSFFLTVSFCRIINVRIWLPRIPSCVQLPYVFFAIPYFLSQFRAFLRRAECCHLRSFLVTVCLGLPRRCSQRALSGLWRLGQQGLQAIFRFSVT